MLCKKKFDFRRLQTVGNRSRVGHGTADGRWRPTGRLRMRFAVDAGPVGREGDERETRGQHRVRAVVRVGVLFVTR